MYNTYEIIVDAVVGGGLLVLAAALTFAVVRAGTLKPSLCGQRSHEYETFAGGDNLGDGMHGGCADGGTGGADGGCGDGH